MSKVDFFSGIGIMVFSAIVFILADAMPKAELGIGPGDYPQFFAVFLFVLGLMLSVQSYIRGMKQGKKLYTKSGIFLIGTLLVLTFAYIGLMPYIGFLFLTPFYLFAAMLLFGSKQYIVVTAVSIGFSVGIHWIFTSVFQVILPRFTLL